MTDEEALSEANRERDNVAEQFWSVSDIDPEFAAGFRAGLAHARTWRPLTSDPASWPEEGQEILILTQPGNVVIRTFAPYPGWLDNGNHWCPMPQRPLPPPPKGESK